jgi:uncharacterized protein (TIRG00374 family)
MARKSNPIRSLLKPSNIIIPIILGLGVASYLLYVNFDSEAFKNISWTSYSIFWLFCALLMVATRDLGYMYRIRVLTKNEISWRNSFDVIMLWEFASAVSPSIVGGSGIALFIINKEGISIGRSTAVVMVTALLDELFYIIMVPIVILIAGTAYLFPVSIQKEIFGVMVGTQGIFIVGYSFIFLLTLIISIAIFFAPKGFKNVLGSIFSISFLKRWKTQALQTGDEIIITSAQLKVESFSFWFKAFMATFFSWTARFWVVNFIILAFTAIPIGFSDHMLIYARQLIMWVIMLISPTPGGSGVAELAFSGFLRDFIQPFGIAGSIALLWRLLSYYPYLFIGAFVLPRWLQRVYFKRKLIRFNDRNDK